MIEPDELSLFLTELDLLSASVKNYSRANLLILGHFGCWFDANSSHSHLKDQVLSQKYSTRELFLLYKIVWISNKKNCLRSIFLSTVPRLFSLLVLRMTEIPGGYFWIVVHFFY